MRTFSAITSRRPFTLLGLILGLVVIVAFILVALNASAGNSSPQETVVYATKDLQPRVPVSADALATKSIAVPADYPKIYFANVADVRGMIPLVTISSGQAITSNDVVKPNQALGSAQAYANVARGYVAMTIPTSEQIGVGNLIQSGDYISIIATVSTSGHIATQTIYTQVRVLDAVGSQGGSGASATSLVIEVTECEAEVITWFQANSSLKYTLESYHDYAPSDQSPDPGCPSVADAHGVNLQFVKSKFPGLF